MLFEQISTKGLAHYSYLLGDRASGQCIVIDPRRDVEVYLDIAEDNEMRIVNILETHIHADYVSGSRELASRTGAPISLSVVSDVGYDHIPLEDDEVITLGDMELKAIHTPGHTPEHLCFLVSGGDGSKEPWGLFSGDLLFAGEIGRPDLLGEELEEGLVHDLYQSLRTKILTLGDEIVVYPAHGEGSPCGASIGARPVTTIGYEKQNNPTLQIDDEALFVQTVRDSLSPAPIYYKRVKRVNTSGPAVIGSLPNVSPLSAKEFRELVEDDTLIIDTREMTAYGGGHIKYSIQIGLRDSFPIWAGEIIDQTFPGWAGGMDGPELKLGLVLPEESQVREAQLDLFRIGVDHVKGYLRGGFRTWFEAGYDFDRLDLISVGALQKKANKQARIQIVDVRTQKEWEIGHIPGAKNVYVTDLLEKVGELNREVPLVVYCGTGYRASIAASILKKEGFLVQSIPGSMAAWRNAGFPEEKP